MTPPEDYRFLTQTCCGRCGHLHPKETACVARANHSLPADHPKRAEREPIVYASFRCSCENAWTVAALEGEIPEGSDVCRCGEAGELVGRS